MYDITFQPFVGKDYHLQSPKILILGESHYEGERESDEGFTIMVIKKYAQREHGERRKFFTIIAKNVDVLLNNETAKNLWDKVSFYNYVQTIVGTGSRQRPTEDMFSMSRQAFKTVVELLRTDVIVVLGRHLSSHLAWNKDYFVFSEVKPILCCWSHPSSPKYFSYAEAQLAIQTAREQFIVAHGV